jgi:hypothetical protein
VSAARQKKGIFGRVRAKTGQQHFSAAHFEIAVFEINAAGASRSERCYEPEPASFMIAGYGDPLGFPTASITTS